MMIRLLDRFFTGAAGRQGWILAVALCLLPLSAAAQDDGSDALRVQDDAIRLTLDEAVEIALDRNLTIVLERYNQQQFELGIDRALSIFDFQMGATARLNESRSESTNTLDGANIVVNEGQSLDFRFNQLTSFGGVAGLTFNNGRRESNNNVNFNPLYTSGLSFSFDQPLLRDRGRLPTQRGILVARIQDERNRHFYEQQIVGIVQQVNNGYWELVEAIDQLRVSEEALALAEELHRRNQIQVDVGTQPPLELVRSNANVAERRADIIQARTRIDDAADQLRNLLDLDQGPLWGMEIVPETDPLSDAFAPNLDDAIAAALDERPEMSQQRLELERLELEERFATNQLLPNLNLNLTYGLSGVGGDLFDFDPQRGEVVLVSEGGLDDAWDQVIDGDFNNWAITVNFDYPLQNRAARADKVNAEIEVEKGRVELRRLQQNVVTEVRSAVRGVNSALEQIETARTARELQEKNLEAEEKRYENGMSTSFEVTDVQEDLTRAKSREVTAITSYRRALTEYYRSIGALLAESGIEIDGGEEN